MNEYIMLFSDIEKLKKYIYKYKVPRWLKLPMSHLFTFYRLSGTQI